MYRILLDLAEKNKLKKYEKRHRAEYASCFVNLGDVKAFLDEGLGVQQIQRCFSAFRSEGEGVFRVGQTGVVGARETRLYVYIQIVEEQIFILTIGDKDTQSDDIRRCKRIVREAKRQ